MAFVMGNIFPTKIILVFIICGENDGQNTGSIRLWTYPRRRQFYVSKKSMCGIKLRTVTLRLKPIIYF